MPVQQPRSPLDRIPNLEPAAEQQKELEERLAKTYVPKITAFIVRQRKAALAMKRKLIF